MVTDFVNFIEPISFSWGLNCFEIYMSEIVDSLKYSDAAQGEMVVLCLVWFPDSPSVLEGVDPTARYPL